MIVSAVGILTHPLLDLMNTYGVRLLAPFSWRWFHADTLFIIDPFVLLVLIVGLVATRKAGSIAARFALGAALCYLVMMFAMTSIAEWWVRDGALALLGKEPRRVLAAPVPLHPFERQIIVESDSAYFNGRVRFLPPRVSLYRDAIPRSEELRASVQHDPRARAFLRWSQFPVFTKSGDIILLADARYGGPNTSWARMEVMAPK